MSTAPQFWLVWNPEKNPPRKMHGTRMAADEEAMRLARLYPEQCFYVLKAKVGFKCETSPVATVQLAKADQILF
ncbi:MAG: hypothetical protein CMM07_25690 [Rhodopirellula sp.]|nr:hypothetical protein [Rhodopirellula sp.]